MSREEYMKILGKRLKKLPKSDYERALEYFNEYFDEAGIGNESQAMCDLGTPEQAAEEILCNLVITKTNEDNKSMSHGIRTLWIALLAILTAPITAPILLVCCVGVIVIIAVLLLALFILFTVGSSLLFTVPNILSHSLFYGTTTLSSILMSLGVCLMIIGIGVLVVIGIYYGINSLVLFGSKQIGKKMEERIANHEN